MATDLGDLLQNFHGRLHNAVSLIIWASEAGVYSAIIHTVKAFRSVSFDFLDCLPHTSVMVYMILLFFSSCFDCTR